jgi:proteasome activator subunit 4
MIPLSVIQDDEEHTMHYAQSLPYADKLEHEAQNWLDDIRSNLVISIKAKDFTGGVLAWTKRLSR